MAKAGNVAPYIFLGAAALGAGYLYHTGTLHQFFQFQERKSESELKIRLTGFHAEADGTVMANIEALNPTSAGLQVQSIIGEFIINGKQAGQVKMFGDTVIRPNDQSIIPLVVRVMPAAAGLFRTRGEHVIFRGKINVNNNLLPLTMNYTI